MDNVLSWHCDYNYQTVSGSLDSYPTPLSSDCSITSTSSPSTLLEESGSIIFGISIVILILSILLTGFVWNKIKTKS